MIKDRLKQLRKNKRLTQQALSENIGLSRNVIANIETNGTIPTAKQIEKLSEYYGVSTDYIIKGVDTTLNNDERDILREVRRDKGLLDKIMQVIHAKNKLSLT